MPSSKCLSILNGSVWRFPLASTKVVSKTLVFWYTIKCLYLFYYHLSLLVECECQEDFVLFTDISHVLVRGLTSSRHSKIIYQIKLKLKLEEGSKFPSLISKPSDFQSFSCLFGPARWFSPWRRPSFLLPTAMTRIHCLYTAPSRHEDSLLPRGPQPSLSNSALMWNPRLDSWHLASRRGKLSPPPFN